ncbi:transglutaminase TgpA family protein [Marinobacter fonticola]|uniref:transglutaminase TgpA family protein n=1 Tax=Marinobacter fonticola TaxID=2603215 RepID=UPI0011E734B8|nr:DUF3488 and DUF4129 domain-containing transglutaminase family protein [Marinobacter fonticola]
MQAVTAQALPSKAIVWLLVSFGMLLVPQWDRLPWWLIVACLALATWRWLAQTGRAALPGRLVGTLIMLSLIAVYVMTVQGRFSVETAASFFVLAVGLKWLETRTARDFYVLFFILCYLAAVNFLFQQGILWTLLSLAGIFILLVGLQILNAPDVPNVASSGWKRLGVLFLKTLPVVVLLFVFFPRMAPLWSVPLVSGEAKTGISDQMEPGSISNLAQSSERAFRVTFGGRIPAHRERYWRGLILDRFVDGRWEQWQVDVRQRAGRVQSDGGIGPLQNGEYDVLLEPTYQPWAFALEGSGVVSDNVEETATGVFRFQRPADTAVRYRMAMDGRKNDDAFLSPRERQRYLHLPAEGNPRSRTLAASLRDGTASDSAFIDSLLQRFRQQSYFYTLRPPQMPQDAVDTLMFDAKRGFCAHYASATAFLLRSAGIPARIVVGYQGGSPGANGEYLIVRQYDAHAWVEAWVDGSGWVRVDPTAAIAPDRVESGLRQAMAEEGSFLENEWASPQKYGDMALLQWLSLRLDQVNYEWQRWVVGYQGQTQMNLMSRLPGNLSLRDLGYISAGVLGGALVIAGLWAGWRNRAGRTKDPALKLMAEWQRLLHKRGVRTEPSDTPAALASRASEKEPGYARLHQAFARAMNNHYYGSGPLSHDDHRRLRSVLRQLRRAS